MKSQHLSIIAISVALAAVPGLASAQSVARQWNEVLLNAIRVDTPRPTVHARNLFHLSTGMYDAWAAFDPVARGYITEEHHASIDIDAARSESISFAAYRILSNRFAASPGASTSLLAFDAKVDELGYDRAFTSTIGSSPAAIGNRIAQNIIAYGLADGSNQAANYTDTSGYVPVNPPLVVSSVGSMIVDHGQVVGRGLKDVAVVVGLHEFVPVGRRAPRGCDWRRFERLRLISASRRAVESEIRPPPSPSQRPQSSLLRFSFSLFRKEQPCHVRTIAASGYYIKEEQTSTPFPGLASGPGLAI